MSVAGLLLAAGGGRRMGRPKALVEVDGEPLVVRGARALGAAGLAPCVVVLGAAADRAAAALDAAVPDAAGSGPRGGVEVVVAPDWEQGMGASLRAGLAALADRSAVDAVLVSLVDTPGIGAVALRRVAGARTGPGALARGAVGGRPGHPVLLGRDHWSGVSAGAHGDAGARHYLRARPDVHLVEIADVADPADVDTPGDLARLTRRPVTPLEIDRS